MRGAVIRTGLAVQRIPVAIRDLQHGIDREEQRQPVRRRGIDPFSLAGQLPCTLDPFLRLRWGPHRFGRRVVQEAPECLTAELLIQLRKQDELMPGDVDRFARYGHRAWICGQSHLEVFAQSIHHHDSLRVREVRINCLEPACNRFRKNELLYPLGP